MKLYIIFVYMQYILEPIETHVEEFPIANRPYKNLSGTYADTRDWNTYILRINTASLPKLILKNCRIWHSFVRFLIYWRKIVKYISCKGTPIINVCICSTGIHNVINNYTIIFSVIEKFMFSNGQCILVSSKKIFAKTKSVMYIYI